MELKLSKYKFALVIELKTRAQILDANVLKSSVDSSVEHKMLDLLVSLYRHEYSEEKAIMNTLQMEYNLSYQMGAFQNSQNTIPNIAMSSMNFFDMKEVRDSTYKKVLH